jgi:YD repeat-containing protein
VGQTRLTSRDANGNTVIETRPLAGPIGPVIATTQFSYDGLDRRTRITNAVGAVHGVTYTATGQVATQTDAAGGVTAFTYDQQDRLVLMPKAAGWRSATGPDASRSWPTTLSAG